MCEDNKDLRRAYYDKLYANRDIAVKVANMCASHLFALDNTMPYLSDEDKEKVTFLGVSGDASTKRNAPYVAASEAFKGQADMGMVSCVLQNVQKMYQDDRKKGMWARSLRSYKGNMPVPYQAKRFANLHFAEYTNGNGEKREGCFFTLTGIPMQMRFGRDRSGNRIIVERVADGDYKMCTSSLQFDGKKIFLLLCVDVPKNLTVTTLEYADEVNADLIVIMTEQESSLTSFLLGTYAQQMLTLSHRPILSIRPEEVNGLAK